ncbi:MAG: IS21-like element helper ATPase IstB [Bacillota bacterium]|uniref:IS21-like element helper ATPase IstB n=1 Tax=Desulforudis sp. DRI-14 TaxID=3459793 RepID=UPI00347F8FC1
MLHQTKDKLCTLKLTGMAQALEEQLSQPEMNNLSFEERLGMLVDREWDVRESRKLTRRLRFAKFKQQACVEDVDFRHPRGLDRSIFFSLAECRWIKSCHNVIISGPTGVGKTFLACALGNKACRMGFNVLYFRMSRFLHALLTARADGTYSSLVRKLQKTHLLILDDWGLTPIELEQARELFDILEDRNQLGSTLIVSQIPVSQWHEAIADPTIADAILDRLVHNAYKLELRGESMRKTMSKLD